jgi:hypothetical protein
MIGQVGLFLLGVLVGGLAYVVVMCLFYGLPKSLSWAARGLVSYRLALDYLGFAILWASVLVVAAVLVAILAPGFQERLMESRALAWGRNLSFTLSLLASVFGRAGRADFIERARRYER